MYHYQGSNHKAGNSFSRSGTLVECLRTASRMYKRQGMIGSITRPDGTNLRDYARKVPCPQIIISQAVKDFELESYLVTAK